MNELPEQDEKQKNDVLSKSTVERYVMLLYRTGRELWTATLNGTPAAQERFKKMQDIKIGDLVIEISSFGLQSATVERTMPAIGWLSNFDGERYFIERLDNGELQEWSNAEFIKIPIET